MEGPVSRSIIEGDKDGACYLCRLYGRPPEALADHSRHPAIQVHHIFEGVANRKLSEHYGLKVHLCIYHHTVGPDAVHNNRVWDRKLKEIGQKTFEEKYGEGTFLQVFGKSYLGEDK